MLEAEGIAADDDALTLIARHADGGMRDALSVLDQCLSFGEGAVTAARVREVLGLVSDELYAEVLTLVVERRPEGVFPLVERLVDGGADLVEFMGGAGELLRALLMLQLGGEPQGLTEALRQRLEEYRDRLEAGDVLRMLRLMADSEVSIRRSANPRLVVETLLLRWAMMDRIVDLREVIAGGRGPAVGRDQAGQTGRRADGQPNRRQISRPPAFCGTLLLHRVPRRVPRPPAPPARPPAGEIRHPFRLGRRPDRRAVPQPVPRRGARRDDSGRAGRRFPDPDAAGAQSAVRGADSVAGRRWWKTRSGGTPVRRCGSR